MCAQLRQDAPKIPSVGSSLVDEPFGIPPYEAQIALQQDVVKELVNKIAWALGSVYRRNYRNIKTPVRARAWEIVKVIIEDHGYPDSIRK